MYKVVLTFESVDIQHRMGIRKSSRVTIQIKAVEQHFCYVHKVVLTFESVDIQHRKGID